MNEGPEIVLRHLEPQFKPGRRVLTQYYALNRLLPECAVLLSALANGNEFGNGRDRLATRAAVARELGKLLPLADQRGLDVAIAWIAGSCGPEGSPVSLRVRELEQSEPAGSRRLAFAIARKLIETGRATASPAMAPSPPWPI